MGFIDYATVVSGLSPVAHWRFGEASGTTAADEIGTLDGTYTGSPTLGATGGIYNDPDTCMSVDSTGNELVIIPHDASVDFDATDTCSFSIWVKTANASASHTIFRKMPNAVPFDGYWLLCGSPAAGRLRIWFRNATGNEIEVYTTSATINDDVWHHLLLTYDGSTNASGVTLYIDGVDTALTTDTDTLSGSGMTNTSSLDVGAVNWNVSGFDGELDEFAVWNTELSANDARLLYQAGHTGDMYAYTLTTKPKYYWRCDETSGTTATDTMAAQNLTYVGSPTQDVKGVYNQSGSNAVELLQSGNQHIAGSSSTVFDIAPADAVSLSAWVRSDGTWNDSAPQEMILSKWDSSPIGGWQFTFQSSYLFFTIRQQNSPLKAGLIRALMTSKLPIGGGNWHHVAVTKGSGLGFASNAVLYIDGEAQAEDVTSDNNDGTFTNGAVFYIGDREVIGVNELDGPIKDAVWWDRQLTAQEVQNIWQLGRYR